MPAPYSYDLRSKAIEAVNRGQRKTDVCRLLQISRNTLDLWLKKDKETGNIRPKEPRQKGAASKIKEQEIFKEFIRENSDKAQQQIAELWGDSLT